ncbi:MAG: non-canonical purine NTP pyrophosphatase [candidate division NC10 bacterium]
MPSASSPSRPLLVLATLNPGKGRELSALLGDIPFEVRTLAELGGALPEETEDSYRGNALLKARAAARVAPAWALADDSGIEVDALGGAPGVRSARYGGPGLDDAGRCRRLLEALRLPIGDALLFEHLPGDVLGDAQLLGRNEDEVVARIAREVGAVAVAQPRRCGKGCSCR